jgi:hypothetical protein
MGGEAIHWVEVDGVPIQMRDDHRRRTPTQRLPHVIEIRGKGLRVDVVQQDRHVGTDGRSGEVVAPINGERDRGARSIPYGTEERRG